MCLALHCDTHTTDTNLILKKKLWMKMLTNISWHLNLFFLQHLMNEWLIEKSQQQEPAAASNKPSLLPPKSAEPLEIQTVTSAEEEEAEFVRCVPSPHASSLSHLRRNSVSSTNSDRKAVNSASVSQFESMGLGSAKKVWQNNIGLLEIIPKLEFLKWIHNLL